MVADKIKKIAIKIIPKILLRDYLYMLKKYRYIKKAKDFKGTNVYGTCCEKTFSSCNNFKIDEKYNDKNLFPAELSNVVCPCCVSMPRHRILCDYLSQNKERLFPEKSKTLVFAPVYSVYIWFKRNKLKYISADLTEKTVDINIDIQCIPFTDNEFDFISCDHVLEHVPDYKRAVGELYRIIKPGGFVEITVPLLPGLEKTYENESIVSYFDRAKAFGQYDHLRMFGGDFANSLKEAGFVVSLYDGDDCDKRIMPLTAPAAYDYNKIFICKKP